MLSNIAKSTRRTSGRFDAAESGAPHLLAVDDDEQLLELYRRYFGKEGFRVSTVLDGTSMRRILGSDDVDIVLLDLGLPNESGLELARYLREHWRGAVIIVSGRGDAVDRIVGLEVGADDYVAKPFELRELLARVRSVLRRSAPMAQANENTVVRFAGYSADLDARSLTGPTGSNIELTTGEFDLLQLFLAHPYRALSRDDVMRHLHGREAGPFDRAIDASISRLRRKIELDPAHPNLIKSIRGIGYKFTATLE